MKKILVLLVCLLVSGNAFAFPPIGGTSKAVISGPIISANLAATGVTMPSNFVGWSAETQDMIAGGIYVGGSPLLSLAGLLGKNGILRVGGTTQDSVTPPTLNQATANNLASFLTSMGAGWSLVYGLDIGANDPTTAVTQAGYIINAVGINNVIFQIGNEPNLNLTTGQYTTRWNSYYSALIAAYPTIKLGAPDTTQFPGDTADLNVQAYSAGLTASESRLSIVSSHFYPLNATGPPSFATILATPDAYNWTYNSAYAPGKLALTETNAIANGGANGRTNALGGAAWLIDVGINTAKAGFLQLNQHNVITPYIPWGHPSYYNSFALQGDGNYSAGANFYALYLLSKVEGHPIITTTVSGLNSVDVLGTLSSAGNANMLIVNLSTLTSRTFSPDQSKSWSNASVLILSGSACNDTAPTLGGAVIGENGAWAGSATTLNYGGTVTIPPCGSALIQING